MGFARSYLVFSIGSWWDFKWIVFRRLLPSFVLRKWIVTWSAQFSQRQMNPTRSKLKIHPKVIIFYAHSRTQKPSPDGCHCDWVGAWIVKKKTKTKATTTKKKENLSEIDKLNKDLYIFLFDSFFFFFSCYGDLPPSVVFLLFFSFFFLRFSYYFFSFLFPPIRSCQSDARVLWFSFLFLFVWCGAMFLSSAFRFSFSKFLTRLRPGCSVFYRVLPSFSTNIS